LSSITLPPSLSPRRVWRVVVTERVTGSVLTGTSRCSEPGSQRTSPAAELAHAKTCNTTLRVSDRKCNDFAALLEEWRLAPNAHLPDFPTARLRHEPVLLGDHHPDWPRYTSASAPASRIGRGGATWLSYCSVQEKSYILFVPTAGMSVDCANAAQDM